MVAFAGLCTASAEYGMGVHATDLSTDEQVKGMLLLLAGQSVIAVSMGISKCAVAAFLMRIVVSKWYELLCPPGPKMVTYRKTGTRHFYGSGTLPSCS